MRTLGKVLLAPTLASGLIAVGTTGAQAAPNGYPGYFKQDNVPIYSAFTIYARQYGTGYYNQEFYVLESACSGYPINSNPCWDRGYDVQTGAQGWVWYGYLAFS
jgi:hypothetical protein